MRFYFIVADYGVNCLKSLIHRLCFFGQPMEKSKKVKITLMAVTTALPIMILLFAAATTIAPLQQAYSLSKYVLTADNTNPATDDASEKIYQPLEKDLPIKLSLRPYLLLQQIHQLSQ